MKTLIIIILIIIGAFVLLGTASVIAALLVIEYNENKPIGKTAEDEAEGADTGDSVEDIA